MALISRGVWGADGAVGGDRDALLSMQQCCGGGPHSAARRASGVGFISHAAGHCASGYHTSHASEQRRRTCITAIHLKTTWLMSPCQNDDVRLKLIASVDDKNYPEAHS